MKMVMSNKIVAAINEIKEQGEGGLDSAWGDGNNNGLQDAINVMFLLQPAAQALFGFTLPDGSGVYGPDFVI
jgi:hypothetical protein